MGGNTGETPFGRDQAGSHGPTAPEAARIRGALEDRLGARDREGLIRAGLAAVRAGEIGVADLYTLVLGPMMVDLGDRWQAGRTRVWEEHLATQAVRSLIEALAPDVMDSSESAASAGQSVLLACPPGEQHDLGLRMLADRFRLGGWQVSYLGTDTPVDEIVDATRSLGVDLVVLSASTHYNRVLLADVAAQLRTALPGVRLGVGGPAFALDREWPQSELLDTEALGLPGSAGY